MSAAIIYLMMCAAVLLVLIVAAIIVIVFQHADTARRLDYGDDYERPTGATRCTPQELHEHQQQRSKGKQ